jgi:hypothetical protein
MNYPPLKLCQEIQSAFTNEKGRPTTEFVWITDNGKPKEVCSRSMAKNMYHAGYDIGPPAPTCEELGDWFWEKRWKIERATFQKGKFFLHEWSDAKWEHRHSFKAPNIPTAYAKAVKIILEKQNE